MIIDDLPTEEILLSLPEEERICGICGNSLKPLGRTFVREELQYIPAQLKRLVYVQESYECPSCKHTDKPYIIKTLAPKSLMNHSLASPSSVAHVMYQKYVQGLPLYRQEKDWEAMGIMLSRATMANWVIRCAEEYFYPVTEYLRKKLLLRDIVHVDETPVQVLKEDGKKPQSKSYMWLYRTGDDGREPIILYDYQPSRSGENAADYLKEFRGYVHSDGYSGYNKLKGITRCGCWHTSDESLWKQYRQAKRRNLKVQPQLPAEVTVMSFSQLKKSLRTLVLKIDTPSVLTVKNRFLRSFGRGSIQ